MRKICYNLTVTALSVAVTLLIGTIEIISIITDRFEITTGPLPAIGELSLDYVGYAVVALFVLTWALALLVRRFARIEERWSARIPVK